MTVNLYEQDTPMKQRPRDTPMGKLAERMFEAAIDAGAPWIESLNADRHNEYIADLTAELEAAVLDRTREWLVARGAGVPLGAQPMFMAVSLERDPPLAGDAPEAPRGGRDAQCLLHGRRRCAECWG